MLLSVSLMVSTKSFTRFDSLSINDHLSVECGRSREQGQKTRTLPPRQGFRFLSRHHGGNLLRPSFLARSEFLRFRLSRKCPQSNHISEKLLILLSHDHYWVVERCKWGKVLHTVKIVRNSELKVTINSAFPVPQGDFKLCFKKEAKSQIPQKFLELALNESFTELLAVVRY